MWYSFTDTCSLVKMARQRPCPCTMCPCIGVCTRPCTHPSRRSCLTLSPWHCGVGAVIHLFGVHSSTWQYTQLVAFGAQSLLACIIPHSDTFHVKSQAQDSLGLKLLANVCVQADTADGGRGRCSAGYRCPPRACQRQGMEPDVPCLWCLLEAALDRTGCCSIVASNSTYQYIYTSGRVTPAIRHWQFDVHASRWGGRRPNVQVRPLNHVLHFSTCSGQDRRLASPGRPMFQQCAGICLLNQQRYNISRILQDSHVSPGREAPCRRHSSAGS